MLKGTRYDWLYDSANMSDERFVAFKVLVRREVATARARARRRLNNSSNKCSKMHKGTPENDFAPLGF